MATPLTEHRRKQIASLTRRKYRTRYDEMRIEGTRSVEAAVAAGAALVDVVVSEAALGSERVRRLVESVSVPVYVVSEREMARLADVEASQGVLAVARPVLEPPDGTAAATRVLVLDGVQDPGNVGAIVRSAAWFGVDAVVAGPGTADFFNPKAVRAAMGGLWDVRLSLSNDLSAHLDFLRARGFRVYGGETEGTLVSTWSPVHPSALVLGSEANGITPVLRNRLDERVGIAGSPRRAGTESLNVAVAAGILLYRWHNAD
jgi:RNA methyltransferase, TrmH family